MEDQTIQEQEQKLKADRTDFSTSSSEYGKMSFFQRLLSGSFDKEKPAKEAEVQTIEVEQPFNPYTELLLLQSHTDIIRILLLIDSKRCVTAADDNKAVIWNIIIGYQLAVLSGHTHPITSIVILPPRRDKPVQLLTGSSDKQIRRWDVKTGECLQVISDHGTSVRCLTLVDIGMHSMFCSGGQELCLWSTDGKLLDRFKVNNTEEADICYIIRIMTDRIVTAVDKQLVVYSVTSADLDGGMEEENKRISLVKKLPPHREAIRCLINIKDGYFASGSIDGTIILWKTETLLPNRYFNSMTEYLGPDKMYPYSIQCMITVDERYILAAVGAGFSLYDSVSGKLVLHKKVAHYSKILCLTFACEGMFLVTASEDGAIRLWGRKQIIQEAMQTDTLPERKQGILGTFLYLKSEESIDLNTEVELDLLGECLAHSGAVQVLMNVEGEGLMSGAADGLVIVWKSSQLQMVKRNRLIQGKQQQLEEDILGMHSDLVKRNNCPV